MPTKGSGFQNGSDSCRRSAARSDAAEQMPALTGIRLPLALWVIGHHLSAPGRPLESLGSATPLVRALLEPAWVTLSVFFAISGFVLARRYRTTTWTGQAVARYAAARFGRIYPLYGLSLLIMLPIILEALRQHTLGSPAERSGLLLNYVLLLQGWHWPSVNWNTPAWSLSCEMFFYACAPLIVGLVRVASWRRVLAAAGLAFAIPIGLRLLIAPPIPKALLYFGDFLIGVAAGAQYDLLRARQPQLRRVGPWLYWPALAGVVALLLFREALGSFLLFDAGVRLASVLLVLGLACGGGWLVRVLAGPVVLAGGRASYAIYILHVPVLWWFERSWWFTAVPPAAAGLIYTAVVVALSFVASRFYEEPMNGLVRRWLRPRSVGRASGRSVATPSLRVPVVGGSGNLT